MLFRNRDSGALPPDILSQKANVKQESAFITSAALAADTSSGPQSIY